MAEYIEREALSKWLHETMKVQTTTVGMAHVRDFWNKVLDAPAADVAPVVHGRWIVKNGRIVCDQCEALWSVCPDRDVQKEHLKCVYETEKFCYNCGARMDGE